MRVQCAWCKRWFPDKPPFESEEVSHTICDPCSKSAKKIEGPTVKRNPLKDADFMTAKGWALTVGTRTRPKVFLRTVLRTVGNTLSQMIQREARAWRLLQKSVIGKELVSVGEFPLLSDASIVADKEVQKLKPNPGAAWHRKKAGEARAMDAQAQRKGKKMLSDFFHGKEVAHTESELAASAMHANPQEPVIDAFDPIYTKTQKLPKYSGAVSPISAHGRDGVKMLIRRLPSWTKEDHRRHGSAFDVAATHLASEYHALIRQEEGKLKRRGIDPGPLISGIVSWKFPEHVKDRLRTLARAITQNKSAAWLHHEASRSRMTKHVQGNPLAVFTVGNPLTRTTALRYAKKLAEHERAGIKENPPDRISATVQGIIYHRCLEIRAEKTGWKPGLYRHPFARRSGVQVLALDNGDILIHSSKGKRLWKEAT